MATGLGSPHGDMATEEEQDNLSRSTKKVKTGNEDLHGRGGGGN